MKIVIYVLILVIAVGLLLRRLKGGTCCCSLKPNEQLPPADESGPTQTGRYRVRQMMARRGTLEQAKKIQEAARAPEEEMLPDPFTLDDLPEEKK